MNKFDVRLISAKKIGCIFSFLFLGLIIDTSFWEVGGHWSSLPLQKKSQISDSATCQKMQITLHKKQF